MSIKSGDVFFEASSSMSRRVSSKGKRKTMEPKTKNV